MKVLENNLKILINLDCYYMTSRRTYESRLGLKLREKMMIDKKVLSKNLRK
jgi:hypothetical protein